MRTILHLGVLVWGIAIVYFGLSDGVPRPTSGREWGHVVAFGFGVAMILVGLRFVWQRLTDSDAPLSGLMALFILGGAAAVTAGVVASAKRAKRPTQECRQILDHVRALFDARDPSGRMGAGLEGQRATLMRRCEEMPTERRRCPLHATTYEEFTRCP